MTTANVAAPIRLPNESDERYAIACGMARWAALHGPPRDFAEANKRWDHLAKGGKVPKPREKSPATAPLARYDAAFRAKIDTASAVASGLDEELAGSNMAAYVIVDGGIVAADEEGEPIVSGANKRGWDYADFEDRLPRVAIVLANADEAGLLASGRFVTSSLDRFYVAWEDAAGWHAGLFARATNASIIRCLWEAETEDPRRIAAMVVRHRMRREGAGPIWYMTTTHELLYANRRFEAKYGDGPLKGIS